jgi:hypothetical protein
LIEETADVEIMLGQLKCCYDIEQKVADYKSEKMKKIAQRLENWEKENL